MEHWKGNAVLWERWHRELVRCPYPLLIITLGTAMRLRTYLEHGSLWFDEAALAINLRRTLPDLLFQPLSFDQSAPPGFLLIQWLATRLLGDCELALRLFPLLSGLATLFLLRYIARRLLDRWGAMLALFWVAINPALVYYSGECKQYASDVLCSLAVVGVLLRAEKKPLTWRYALVAAGVGAGAILFSNPAVFILAGGGLVLLVQTLLQHRWSDLKRLAVVLGIWSVVALAYVVIWIAPMHLERSSFLIQYWRKQEAFLPLDPTRVFRWLWKTLVELTYHPLQVARTWVVLVLALTVVGIISLARRSPSKAALLVAGIPFLLLASALERYPIKGRLMLFYVPLWSLIIAEGIVVLWHWRARLGPVLALALMVLLSWQATVQSGYRLLVEPWRIEETRPLLTYLAKEQKPGDIIYIYSASAPVYCYYAPLLDLPPSDRVFLEKAPRTDDGTARIARLGREAGDQRLWLLFSRPSGTDELRLVHAANEYWSLVQIRSITYAARASLYLFVPLSEGAEAEAIPAVDVEEPQ